MGNEQQKTEEIQQSKTIVGYRLAFNDKGEHERFPVYKEEEVKVQQPEKRMKRLNMFGDKHMYFPDRLAKRNEELKIWFKEQREDYEESQK